MDKDVHKKVFFVSDFHLGADALMSSKAREKKIVSWLSEIEDEVEELYLVGDVFDYWYEYRKVVPKGFSRILGKLAAYRDKGIPVYFLPEIMICGCSGILKMSMVFLLIVSHS